MASTEKKSTSTEKKSTSILFIIQLIFIACYYLDSCQSDPPQSDSCQKCLTVIPCWPLWAVWFPTILGWGIVVLTLLLACCIACLDSNKGNKKEKNTIREDLSKDQIYVHV